MVCSSVACKSRYWPWRKNRGSVPGVDCQRFGKTSITHRRRTLALEGRHLTDEQEGEREEMVQEDSVTVQDVSPADHTRAVRFKVLTLSASPQRGGLPRSRPAAL